MRQFIHDCEDCKYLGCFDGNDLYFCPGEKPYGTIIARYGNDGPEYASGICFGKNPFNEQKSTLGPSLRVAYLIAVDMGFITDPNAF